jgi:hypothetical protein
MERVGKSLGERRGLHLLARYLAAESERVEKFTHS